MTIPSGAAAINPDLKFGVTNNISSLYGRTRGNVVTQLRDEKYPNSVPENWDGKKVKATQVEGIDASKVTTGTFADARVPSVGELRDAIYQAIAGGAATGITAAQVKTALTNFRTNVLNRLDALEAG
jgi:hypothetical protein